MLYIKIIYKNYIKRFNYITGYAKYLNFNIESLNKKWIDMYKINDNIKYIPSILKFPKSYYNSDIFISIYKTFIWLLFDIDPYKNDKFVYRENGFVHEQEYSNKVFQVDTVVDYGIFNTIHDYPYNSYIPIQINLNLEKYIDLPTKDKYIESINIYKEYKEYEYKTQFYKTYQLYSQNIIEIKNIFVHFSILSLGI